MAATTPGRQPALPASSFDYTVKPSDLQDIWEGFRVADHASVNRQVDLLYRRLCPEGSIKGGRPAATKEGKAKRKKIGATIHNRVTELSEAPEPWKTTAMSHLMALSKTRTTRRKNPDESGHLGQPPLKRERQEDSDDDIHPIREAKRSRSIVTPIYTRTISLTSDEWLLDPDHALPSIEREEQLYDAEPARPNYYFQFRSVQDGHVCESVEGEVSSQALEVSGDACLIRWERLVNEAREVRRPGFCFEGKLWITPRSKGHLPIRSQVQLDTALQEIPSGCFLTVTTAAVQPSILPVAEQTCALPTSRSQELLDTTDNSPRVKQEEERTATPGIKRERESQPRRDSTDEADARPSLGPSRAEGPQIAEQVQVAPAAVVTPLPAQVAPAAVVTPLPAQVATTAVVTPSPAQIAEPIRDAVDLNECPRLPPAKTDTPEPPQKVAPEELTPKSTKVAEPEAKQDAPPAHNVSEAALAPFTQVAEPEAEQDAPPAHNVSEAALAPFTQVAEPEAEQDAPPAHNVSEATPGPEEPPSASDEETDKAVDSEDDTSASDIDTDEFDDFMDVNDDAQWQDNIAGTDPEMDEDGEGQDSDAASSPGTEQPHDTRSESGSAAYSESVARAAHAIEQPANPDQTFDVDIDPTTKSAEPQRQRPRMIIEISDDDDDDDEDANDAVAPTQQDTMPVTDEFDQDDDDEQEKENTDNSAKVARAYATAQLAGNANRGAYEKAQKKGLAEWEDAAHVFLLLLKDLKLDGDRKRVDLPTTVGLSPEFQPMPIQLVAAAELIKTTLGPRGAGVLADEMGLGKSAAALLAFWLNLAALIKLQESTKDAPFPPMKDGRVLGVKPRIGATFIMGNVSGLEAFFKAWVLLFQGSNALDEKKHGRFTPKLIFLYKDKTLAERYGGEANGIYTSLTKEQWSEINRAPDWSKARKRYGDPLVSEAERADRKWVRDKTLIHPDATTETPAPSSTSYVILSTRQSWMKQIGCTFAGETDAAFKALAAQKKVIGTGRAKPKQMSEHMEKEDEAKAAWVEQRGGRIDGDGPMQAKRATWVTTTKGERLRVYMVVDVCCAAFIMLDELHTAGLPGTQTYSQIVRPFLPTRPAIIGITGTPFANGIELVMTFTEEVLQKLVVPRSADAGARALAVYRPQKHSTTWSRVLRIFVKMQKTTGRERNRIRDQLRDDSIVTLFSSFSDILAYFFIQRDYHSEDPWGRRLRIVDAVHKVEYLDIQLEKRWFGYVKAAEDQVQAAVKRRHDEAMAIWEDSGKRDNAPTMVAMSKADPHAFLRARLANSFPNLIPSIEAWDKGRPRQRRVFGNTSSLGPTNPIVKQALGSETSVRSSFLWDIAKDACKGSAKVDHIMAEIKRLHGETSTIPHPRRHAGRGETLVYESKYVVVSSLRIARALVWARLVQEWPDKVATAWDAKSRMTQIPRWQRVWDDNADTRDDKVSILVAGLGIISEGITLTEGHVFEGLEPPLSSHAATQYANRGYRIGQTAKVVHVNWLTTVPPDQPDAVMTIDKYLARANTAKKDFQVALKSSKAEDRTSGAKGQAKHKGPGKQGQAGLDRDDDDMEWV